VPDALNYIDQVLSALSYAHQQHVIHRDIKPANMMLTPAGVVKLMDFGIARTEDEPSKLTATGSTLGSMNYMSPEQVKGERTDERSDLYSVGISLYEMVTGEKPFHGDSNFSIMAAQINQAPRPPVELHPGLPEGLNEIILTSIAKSPEQRFQSAGAFRNAIRKVLLSLQEGKTVVQGSYDATASAVSAPVPYVRTTPVATAKVQSATAVPVSSKVPVPAMTSAAKSHRGFYMGLGALVVLVVLFAAGIYMPGKKKASAAEDIAGSSTVAPSTTTPPVAPTQTAVAEKPPPQPTQVPEEIKPAPVAKKLVAANKSGATGQTTSPVNNSQAAAAAALAAELDEIEHQIDQLQSRAAAVNNGLDHLQQQQAAAGYGLRGDIASKQASMKVNLAKAQNAIEHNDAARAKRYAEMTEADLGALEKFLGR
jgi:serine/threonine-protein kinase